ncbi:MAG: PorV/PorQ family protein [Candidatus Margulisbacteria bacterium]|nr:PorV/PorQ family protein [Candidatus Margulisiibacteriota bacterium]
MARSPLFASLIICLLLAACASAESPQAGSTGAAYLSIGNGVRGAGMGGAFSSVADEVTAMYWNPAGIGRLTRPELSATYNMWLLDTNYSTVHYLQPSIIGNFGVSAFYLNYGAIEETTLTNRTGTGRAFTPSSYVFNLTWAKEVWSNLCLGASAKLLQENIDAYSEGGSSFDFGLTYKSEPLGMNFGLSLMNVGSSGGDKLGETMRMGFSKVFWDRLLVALDCNLPGDRDVYANLGFEYIMNDILALRCGYNTLTQENAGGNWGIGVGLRLSRFNVDYAYVPYEDLGSAHRIGLKIGF